MRDKLNRNIDYLRFSITDRCNLRCKYCMGDKDIVFLPKDELLSVEEVGRVTKIFSDLGIKKIRITGGEPLVRRNFRDIVETINNIETIEEINITTNGIRLSEELEFLKDKKIQIGVLSTNSQGHILLGMAAKAELGDAHAFDNVLNSVDNASGFDGIKSGSIKAHIVISPYNFKELAVEGTHEIAISEDVWVPGDTSIVGIASKNLYENNKDLYNAVCKALDEAMQYVKNNPEETAQLVKDKLELDDSVEDIVKWMTDSKSQYSTTLQGVGNFVQFMQDEGFLENEYSGNLSDIVYDGVKGK